MKALIIGCGKFGIQVAGYLVRKNHNVMVIDSNPESFIGLGEEFTGQTICGIGYDKDVLEQAGIETADVVIGCTSSDSLNAVVANIAKNVFHVPTVIARMYDPIRARMFDSMGIYTVSITRLGLDNVMEYLEGNKSWRVIRKLGNGVQLVKARIPVSLEGKKFSELEVSEKIALTAVERHGRSFVPEKEMRCEYNDILYMSVCSDYLEQAKDKLQL